MHRAAPAKGLVKPLLVSLAVTAALGLFLFLDTTPVRLSRTLGPIAAEILATFRDPGTQWMVYACCAIYFFTFILLEKRRAGRGFWCWDNPDLWLCGMVVWITAIYAFDYDVASRNTHALALMAGAAIGKGVGVWAQWGRAEGGLQREEGNRSSISAVSSSDVATLIVNALVLLLAVVALWQPEAGTVFKYRGEARWQGPWDNPNLYGLLMGTGLVLAVGMLFRRCHMEDGRWKLGVSKLERGERGFGQDFNTSRPGSWSALLHVLWSLPVIAATALCAYGLVRSYSRGAWVGTALGLAVLGFQAFKLQASSSVCVERLSYRACVSWFIKNRFSLLILFTSLFVLAFWEFRHTEQPLIRRIFTVGNPNDFSWRNRVAAWEGALGMMAENPINGVGWSRTEAMYDHYYRPVKVDEGMAIQLNHYFVLGMSAGLPALICFLGYVGMALARRNVSEVGDQRGNETAAELNIGNHRLGLAAICHAGAIVLLVGLWFDGGLFNLATAAPLWMLLALGALPRVAQTSDLSPSEQVRSGWLRHIAAAVHSSGSVVLLVLGFALLSTGLLWAHARDPFHRIELSIKPTGIPATAAVVVMPKSGGPFPVVLWVYGSGGDLIRSGDELRQIAELGLAAVCFQYDKTNQAKFDAQLLAVLEFVSHQHWADADKTGWIANSLGAQRTLDFFFQHPEQAPQVMVRLNGGAAAEALQIGNGSWETGRGPLTKIWLIHGENDEVFPVAEVKRSAEQLKAQGFPLRLSLFAGRGHSFGADQPLLIRAAAEYCATELGGGTLVPINVRPLLVGYWVPIGLIVAVAIVLYWRNGTPTMPKNGRILVVATSAICALAIADTGVHLTLPSLAATQRTINWAQRFVVRPELRGSFYWLAEQMQSRNALERLTASNDSCAPPNLRTVLEHVELSSLQRQLCDWEVSDELWKDWVLSPWIDGSQDNIRWRRLLWERFYPRVRRERSVVSAAEIVGRELALSVRIKDEARQCRGIAEMWIKGTTDQDGFEYIYVAALRSVGIPARIGDDGHAFFHNGDNWNSAPRPLLESYPVTATP